VVKASLAKEIDYIEFLVYQKNLAKFIYVDKFTALENLIPSTLSVRTLIFVKECREFSIHKFFRKEMLTNTFKLTHTNVQNTIEIS
jgi:hypothetical protein